MKEQLKEEMEKHFRPEFLNRLDDMIVFRSLTKDDLKQIVDIELGKVRKRLKDHGLELVLTDEAKELIIEKGCNPDFGARPLRRAIESSRRPAGRGNPPRHLQGQGPDHVERRRGRRPQAFEVRGHRERKIPPKRRRRWGRRGGCGRQVVLTGDFRGFLRLTKQRTDGLHGPSVRFSPIDRVPRLTLARRHRHCRRTWPS